MTLRPDSRLGTGLGPYRIEAVIGRGGMGVVYRAEQTRLGRKVALKVLAPNLLDDEAFRARFIRESQMAAAIDHPNIIPIYEAGEIEGAFFLAMRYVEGTDLETRLRSGPLEPREAVQLLAQVASALDAANEAGLVHRDVKPANVLIASGKGVERADHAYLTDFGLSKHRGSQSGLTQSGAFMGTLDYIAPEQIEGRPVDGRADQYSLACMAFHALTGAPPFTRETDIAIAMAHLHEVPPSASGARPDLPAAIDAVFARGMAKKPDDRYPSSEAFVGALREALGIRPTERHARRPSRPERRTTVIVVTVIAILVVATLGGFALLAGGSAVPPPTGGSGSGSAGASVVAASPSSSSTSAPFPSLDEASLVLALPDDLPADCVRGAEELLTTRQGPSLKPRAHVTCALTGGSAPDVIDGYLLPPTDFGFWDVLEAIAQREGAAEGNCATSPEARGSWQIDDRGAGAIVCYRDPGTGDAVIAWGNFDARALFLAVDTAGDSAALYDWFAANAADIVP